MSGVGRYVAGLVLAAGCGQSTLGATCRSNDDCAANERCEVATAHAEERLLLPCPLVDCFYSASACPSTYVCASSAQAVNVQINCGSKVCVPPCVPDNPATCPTNMLCREDGSCSYVQCDEPGGITCPEHWRCDPAAALKEPAGLAYTTSPFQGTTVVDPLDAPSAISHGCVRKRCTESDGYTCDATNVCDASQAANGSGCIPGHAGTAGGAGTAATGSGGATTSGDGAGEGRCVAR